MKVCPACRTTFDDSQNFCLSDGTPLVSAEAEPETVVVREASVAQPPASYTNLPPVAPPPQPVKDKSNMGIIVASVLLTVLVIGAGAGGWWYLSRNRSNNSNQQASRTNVNLSSNSNAAPRSSSSVNNANASANVNASNSAVISNNSADVRISPTPVRQLTSREAKEIREETSDTLRDWADAIASNNIDEHLSYYADTLDYYYNARGYSRNQVRADKQRAFAQFDSLEFDVSNIRVTPDQSGERATVVYDKKWYFEGENKSSEGKTQSQLDLKKVDGRWLIIGERDIKVYNQQSY